MQPQRKATWLPISLIALAAAIAFAGYTVGNSITAASAAQTKAQQQTTTAVNQAAMQASNDAYAAQVAATNAAQHQANLDLIYRSGR